MNLYIGNLSAAVRPADLQTMFSGVGQIVYARLAEEPSAAGKGFAFVHVSDESRARETAAALDGKEWMGEVLTVRPVTSGKGIIGGN